MAIRRSHVPAFSYLSALFVLLLLVCVPVGVSARDGRVISYGPGQSVTLSGPFGGVLDDRHPPLLFIDGIVAPPSFWPSMIAAGEIQSLRSMGGDRSASYGPDAKNGVLFIALKSRPAGAEAVVIDGQPLPPSVWIGAIRPEVIASRQREPATADHRDRINLVLRTPA